MGWILTWLYLKLYTLILLLDSMNLVMIGIPCLIFIFIKRENNNKKWKRKDGGLWFVYQTTQVSRLRYRQFFVWMVHTTLCETMNHKKIYLFCKKIYYTK